MRAFDPAVAVASVVRLLDLGAIRIGNECYARDNRSFGATTLRKRHAEVTGRTLRLRYKGKSGQMRTVSLTNAQRRSHTQGAETP